MYIIINDTIQIACDFFFFGLSTFKNIPKYSSTIKNFKRNTSKTSKKEKSQYNYREIFEREIVKKKVEIIIIIDTMTVRVKNKIERERQNFNEENSNRLKSHFPY